MKKESSVLLLLLMLSSMVVGWVIIELRTPTVAVTFAQGEDTSTCKGILFSQDTKIKLTDMPLAVESNITITELVNITNTDTSAHSVQISVDSEDMGSEVTAISLYLVSPTGSQTLVLEIDDTGTTTIQNIPVNIPATEEWAIKLQGCYDSGTLFTQSNTLTLNLQVTE